MKLGELGKVITGSTPSTKDENNYSSNDVCFVKPSDIGKTGISHIVDTEFHISFNAYQHSRKLPKGSVLTTCIGIIGKVGILDVDATCNQQINAIIPDTRIITSSFLAYSILSKRHLLTAIANAPVVPIINKGEFSSVFVDIPQIKVQEMIVDELDSLSEIVAKKKEQLKELDKLAQSVFYDMFGSISERVPLSHYVVSFYGGKSLAGDEECPNKVLKSGAVTYDYFRGDDVKNLPTDYCPREEDKVRAGNLLISRMNTAELVGACAFVWTVNDNVYLPDRLWRVNLKDNANPVYLWKAMIQPQAKEQIRGLASGTSGTMKNISKPKLMSVNIPLVCRSLQNQFAQKIETIEKQKELIKKSITETETLFNSRMDYWFN